MTISPTPQPKDNLKSFVKFLTERSLYYFVKYGTMDRKLDIDLGNGIQYYLFILPSRSDFFIEMRMTRKSSHTINDGRYVLVNRNIELGQLADSLEYDTDLSDKFLVAIKKVLIEEEKQGIIEPKIEEEGKTV